MDTQRKQLTFVAAFFVAAFAVSGYVAYLNRTPSPRRVAAHVASWPAGPRRTVTMLTERYGPPNVLARGIATWSNRKPWKRIVVRGDASDAYLEQTVSYAAPREALASLREFGRGVRVNLEANELTAASSDESLNRLALNLAVQIAVGKRSVADARDFYAKTTRLSTAGKSSPYLTGLLFAPYRAAEVDRRRRGVGY